MLVLLFSLFFNVNVYAEGDCAIKISNVDDPNLSASLSIKKGEDNNKQKVFYVQYDDQQPIEIELKKLNKPGDVDYIINGVSMGVTPVKYSYMTKAYSSAIKAIMDKKVATQKILRKKRIVNLQLKDQAVCTEREVTLLVYLTDDLFDMELVKKHIILDI